MFSNKIDRLLINRFELLDEDKRKTYRFAVTIYFWVLGFIRIKRVCNYMTCDNIEVLGDQKWISHIREWRESDS
jgi:hypothetical protein